MKTRKASFVIVMTLLATRVGSADVSQKSQPQSMLLMENRYKPLKSTATAWRDNSLYCGRRPSASPDGCSHGFPKSKASCRDRGPLDDTDYFPIFAKNNN